MARSDPLAPTDGRPNTPTAVPAAQPEGSSSKPSSSGGESESRHSAEAPVSARESTHEGRTPSTDASAEETSMPALRCMVSPAQATCSSDHPHVASFEVSPLTSPPTDAPPSSERSSCPSPPLSASIAHVSDRRLHSSEGIPLPTGPLQSQNPHYGSTPGDLGGQSPAEGQTSASCRPLSEVVFALDNLRVSLPRELLSSERLKHSFLARLVEANERETPQAGQRSLEPRRTDSGAIVLEPRVAEGFAALVSHLRGDRPLHLNGPAFVLQSLLQLLADSAYWCISPGPIYLPLFFWCSDAWVDEFTGVYPIHPCERKALWPVPWNEKKSSSLVRLRQLLAPPDSLRAYLEEDDEVDVTPPGVAMSSPQAHTTASVAPVQQASLEHPPSSQDESMESFGWQQHLRWWQEEGSSGEPASELDATSLGQQQRSGSRKASHKMVGQPPQRQQSQPDTHQGPEQTAVRSSSEKSGSPSRRVSVALRSTTEAPTDAHASSAGGVHGAMPQREQEESGRSAQGPPASLCAREYFSCPPFHLALDRREGRLLVGVDGCRYPFVQFGTEFKDLVLSAPTAFRVDELQWLLMLNASRYLDIHLSGVPWTSAQKERWVNSLRHYESDSSEADAPATLDSPLASCTSSAAARVLLPPNWPHRRGSLSLSADADDRGLAREGGVAAAASIAAASPSVDSPFRAPLLDCSNFRGVHMVCVHPYGHVIVPSWPLTTIMPGASAFQSPIVAVSSGLFTRAVKEVQFYPWGLFALFSDAPVSRVFTPSGSPHGFSLVIGKAMVFGQTPRDIAEKRVQVYIHEPQQPYVHPRKPPDLLDIHHVLKVCPYILPSEIASYKQQHNVTSDQIPMREYHRMLRLAVSVCGKLLAVISEGDFTLGISRNFCKQPGPLVHTADITSPTEDIVSSGFPTPKDNLFSSQIIGFFEVKTGVYAHSYSNAAKKANWFRNVLRKELYLRSDVQLQRGAALVVALYYNPAGTWARYSFLGVTPTRYKIMGLLSLLVIDWAKKPAIYMGLSFWSPQRPSQRLSS
ncbi:hypothetical protein cyc_02958 [Cyclospora cayetanensis]|uniref:Uncharacterized protein n=1 Tax=Cyclospora cayetanensis TaxID=88456 RepID=A0A1D3D214_9EIME|nr:hypothetical protein cyc_02958 [Cyclospora cayetanensis]